MDGRSSCRGAGGDRVAEVDVEPEPHRGGGDACVHRDADADADRAREQHDQLHAVLPRLVDTSGDRFRIQIGEATCTSRTEAARALAGWSHEAGLRYAPTYRERDHGIVGQISGFDITLATRPGLGGIQVAIDLAGVPRSGFSIDRDVFLAGGVGLIQRIENRAAGIPTYLRDATAQLEDAEQTVRDTDERIGRPFRHADALRDAQARLAEVNHQLEALQESVDTATAEPPATEGQVPGQINGHRPYPAPLAAYGPHGDARHERSAPAVS